MIFGDYHLVYVDQLAEHTKKIISTLKMIDFKMSKGKNINKFKKDLF